MQALCSVALSAAGRLAAVFLLAALIACAQGANNARFEGKIVQQILFEPADQPYSLAYLGELLPIKKGSRFEPREVPQAIQALFSTGRYADIAVDATDSPSGVTLKFITKRAYFVGRVTVSGVREPPNRGQMISATKLGLGRPFKEGDQHAAIESLRDLLRRNGFYQAVITGGKRYYDATEQVDLHFEIEPGERARFEAPLIQGHPGRSPADITRSTHWQRLWGLLGWQQVTQSRVQQGIDNIRRHYQNENLLLAQVNLRSLDYHANSNTVQPNLYLEGGPRVDIKAEGARIGRGKLKQLVPVYQERSVDDDLLMEGQRNLVEYLQAQGYFEATATYHVDDDPETQTKTVTYELDKGERHKLVKLEIAGNRYFTEQTIRERLYLTPAEFPRFPHGRYSQVLLDRDVQAISDLYTANGFRDVKVRRRVVDDFEGKNNELAVYIDIVEGPQTFVSALQIAGLDERDEQSVRSLIRSAPGQPYSEVNIASDRDSILNYLYNNGFLNATFEYKVAPTNMPNRVDVNFYVNRGEQRFVRDIVIGGLANTRPRLVEDRLELSPGDPLSLSKMADSERRLYDLGIFARVNTALQNPDGNEQDKYVLYDFDEARRYSLNVGVGAEFGRIGGGYTLDAPAGRAGFSPRLTLGVSRLNFLGLGHTITFQSKLSNIRQQGGISYLAPQFFGNENLSLTFSGLYDSSHDVRTFSAIRRETSVQLNQKLSKANTIQYRIVLRSVTQTDLLIDPLLVPLLAQPVRVGLLGLSFVQDKRDDPGDAHRGTYTTIDAGYAARFLSSQTQFTRLTFRNSTYHPLNRDLVFARSTYFGWNAPLGQSPIPIAEHYFAGGATTQRAFPENQAGPRDLETGFPLGGNAVLMNNLEMRFPLLGDNVGGVFFLDSGNVYSDIHHISFRFRQMNSQDFDYMVHSAGFGVRYRTPIGPIRVDFSFSPNSPRFYGFRGTLEDFLNPDIRPTLTPVAQRINQFQFHFSLGQAF